MAIRIVRNEDGNCIEFRNSPNPVYWNACLSAVASPTEANNIHIINDIKTNGSSETVYEFFNLPFTDFEDKDGVAFVDRQAAIDYINVNGNVASTPISASYKGVWDASANSPDLATLTPQNGDWYWVTTAGTYDSVDYAVNDQIRYNTTGPSWDKIEDVALKTNDMIDEYNAYVVSGYTGTARTGSIVNPYIDIQTAVDAASDGDHILLNGTFVITTDILLPADKTLYFHGVEGTAVKYNSFDAANGNVFYMSNTSSVKEYHFYNLIVQNAGGYGVQIKSAAKVVIEDCKFLNNGWNGAGLSTVLAESGGTLGFNSSSADLQAFYAGSNASDGGAMRLEKITQAEVIANYLKNNFRGIRVEDCGVGGYGFITRNVSTQNIESGIYLASGSTHSGCQNVIVSMNSSSYNSNNGILLIGGLNNKFSQNDVSGNWNAGFYAWAAANTTLRDCGLYDNNRSQYNGTGENGDAMASIAIGDVYDKLDAIVSANNNSYHFIAEILDTQVHYTGLGSNTSKVGFYISDTMNSLPDNDKNIIKIDDVGFIGQDYAIDLSSANLNNLRLSLGDNSYQSIGVSAVKPPAAGMYSELPFSNHVMSVPSVNVEVDVLKQMISLKEYVNGNVINTYKANELQSVENANGIDIIQRNSNKIQLRGLTLGNVYVNGVAAGNSINSMSNTVNAAFEMDLTEYKDFLVSEVGVNAGETLPAQADNWYIAYGARANEQIVSANVVADVKDVQPFYNGNALEKGHEFTFTHDANGSYTLGVWSGAESATTEANVFSSANWEVGFRFVGIEHRFSGPASTGVDLAVRWTAGDRPNVTQNGYYNVVNNSTVLAIRYGNDNYLYLLEINNGDEVIVARSNTTLTGDTVSIFFAGENQPNAKFPVMQERTDRWTIVHDFDSSEASEWSNGLETDSVIKSNIEISPGEKVTMNFNYFGRAEVIGFGYTGAATGVNNAHDTIQKQLFYNTQEVIKGIESSGDWTWNLNASNSYDPNGDQSDVGYDNSGNLGLISWRYKSDNTLEMWHETNNELMATLTAPLDGNPFNVYFGAAEAMPIERIPVLNKYDLNAVENGSNVSTWYYIESPDGVFTYPLFNNSANALTIDLLEGGSGNSTGFSFPDEPTGATWYGPNTSMVTNGSSAPGHGVFGNSTNVIWNEIAQNADSTAVPTAFSDATISINELASLNFQIHPAGATFTTTIQSGPAWISQATSNANITGTAPVVSGDNVNFPSDSYTVTVVRTNSYGSSTGTLTVTVTNLTAPASLPGTLHAGSVIASSATNSAGKIYLQVTGGHLVYDLPSVLEDGDKIEWYHQDGSYGFGIVSAGQDKTTDIIDQTQDNSSHWDLLAPITGAPTNTNGQNFGNNYSPSIAVGLVPIGWDDNTNPQVIPTRPVYAASDIWKLYNNAGTIELSLNGVLFRSSATTYTNPVITFAMPSQSGSGGVVEFGELPGFTHTANAATAPTGFTLLSGTMDTSDKLNGDAAVTLDNFTVSPGQRFIVTKAWWNTNVLPFIDGSSGEDNKVFLGIPKNAADFTQVVEQDFYAMHRAENQTANLTKITQYYAGPSPSAMHINRSSDTDIHYNMAIEFTREGDIVTMRSPDTDPSLTTEPVGGTFGQTQTWTGAHSTTGTSALGIVLATKETETRAKLSETGISVITAPSKANEFDVTEDTFSAPLFNGDPAGDITLAAGTTYKFWLHSDSIESTDALGICLVSDNSDYTTGVTVVGTPGSFGSYLEFAIPSDVPPVKFKWTSGGSDYYVTPVVAGSTYSASVTGITLEGPSANQTGTNLFDANDHGWLSIDEPLGAGQRLVLSGAFLSDVADAMADASIISFGVKDGSWANTVDTVVPSGFEGGMRISIYRVNATNFQMYGYNGDTSSSTTILPGATLSSPSAFLNYNAFIEVTASGNNIRVGYAATSTHSANTVAYADWGSTTKIQSGDQGYGISTVDVMAQGYATSGTDTTDANDIDWTALSEISVPVPSSILTDWDKAVDFSGGNEHLKQVGSSSNARPLRMNNSSNTVSAHSTDASKTSDDSLAMPWATVIVFKSDRHTSNQHIWNEGEGTSTGNDNIFLRQSASGALIFAWGREGSGYNECSLGTINSSTWYGVYIAHKGQRYSGGNANATNLAAAFDIRIMSSSDSFSSVGSNLSTSSNWNSTGARMDRSITGDFTIGGRGSNRNFHGKIGSMVVTTLRLGVAMPTDAEVKLMITDPRKWEDDYRIGQTVRRSQGSSDVTYANSSVNNGHGTTQIWLMGDSYIDSYANGIRNDVYHADQNYGKLQFNSMSNNDIETVSIPGLT